MPSFQIKVIRACLDGSDDLNLEFDSTANAIVKFNSLILCTQAQEKFNEHILKPLKEGKSLKLPPGADHGSILIREIILKIQDSWRLPYADPEICHCRMVSTHKVDQVIIAGAHTTEQVSRLTMASTSCGSCRGDVQKLIDYRLNNS